MSSYFTVPLFSRAKKDQEDLQRSNPKDPMLRDEDERFLEKQIFTDEATDRIIFRPSPSSPDPTKTPHWDKGIDLPSQADAEAITHDCHSEAASHEPQPAQSSSSSPSPRPWTSYLPSLPSLPKTSLSLSPSSPPSPSSPHRTWTQYATTLLPSRTDTSASPPQILSPSDSLDADATRRQQENELSALLSRLDAGALKGRVFALSAETRELYSRFAGVLRDTLAGVPTAYDDMEGLMREAGPTLERQWKGLPPFVQSLVRGLPGRVVGLGGMEGVVRAVGIMGEEGGGKGEEGDIKGEKKGKRRRRRRRRIPGLKNLLGREGALAGMLRGAVEFVQVRFPFLASMTNLVMSVAVFILMFVCWYCHKRGKEVRLAREADAGKGEGDGDSLRVEYTESGSDEGSDGEDPELETEIEKEIDEKLRESGDVPSDPSNAAELGEPPTANDTNDKK